MDKSKLELIEKCIIDVRNYAQDMSSNILDLMCDSETFYDELEIEYGITYKMVSDVLVNSFIRINIRESIAAAIVQDFIVDPVNFNRMYTIEGRYVYESILMDEYGGLVTDFVVDFFPKQELEFKVKAYGIVRVKAFTGDEAIDKVRGELVPNLPSEFNIEII